MASVEELKVGIENNFLPIEMRDNFRNSTQYPFHALADPDGEVSSLFRVGRRNLLGCIKDALPFRQVVPIVKAAVVDGDPSVTMLPSEFLIDENGIIVDLYRSKTLSKTIPMDRVSCFLMSVKRHSSLLLKMSRQKSNGSGKSSNKSGSGKRSTSNLSEFSFFRVISRESRHPLRDVS